MPKGKVDQPEPARRHPLPRRHGHARRLQGSGPRRGARRRRAAARRRPAARSRRPGSRSTVRRAARRVLRHRAAAGPRRRQQGAQGQHHHADDRLTRRGRSHRAAPGSPRSCSSRVTAVWGSTFFLIHDLVEHVPPADFLAVRFGIAAVVMFALFRRQTLALSRRELRIGRRARRAVRPGPGAADHRPAAHRRLGLGLHHRHLRRADAGARRGAPARPDRPGGAGSPWAWRRPASPCCRCSGFAVGLGEALTLLSAAALRRATSSRSAAGRRPAPPWACRPCRPASSPWSRAVVAVPDGLDPAARRRPVGVAALHGPVRPGRWPCGRRPGRRRTSRPPGPRSSWPWSRCSRPSSR